MRGADRRLVVGKNRNRGAAAVDSGHVQGHEDAVELSKVDCVAGVGAWICTFGIGDDETNS